MKKLLFVLASEMFRDLEYIVPRAICEQAGIGVKTISTTKESIGRFGYKVENDLVVGDTVSVSDYDGIVFVGGLWSLDYIGNDEMKSLALEFNNSKKLVAAICAAPRVLLAYGILDGKNVIGNDWDGNFWEMCSWVSACYMGQEKWVARDENIITAYGPEEAEQFGNKIVEYLKMTK